MFSLKRKKEKLIILKNNEALKIFSLSKMDGAIVLYEKLVD